MADKTIKGTGVDGTGTDDTTEVVKGTTFQEIYCLTNITDKSLDNIPPNLKYAKLYQYMRKSIGFFSDDCYKDIENFCPFSQEEYLYISDGIETSLELPNVPQTLANIYVGRRENKNMSYTEIYGYDYDEENNVIVLDEPVEENYEIYVSFYEKGYFYEKLNLKEQTILSTGIIAVFDDAMRQKDSLLKQRVYNKSSTGFYSQAEHIRVLKDLHDSVYKDMLKNLIIEYTYKQAKDNLWMLAGRQSSYGLGEE